jgi:hypothetical protein
MNRAARLSILAAYAAAAAWALAPAPPKPLAATIAPPPPTYERQRHRPPPRIAPEPEEVAPDVVPMPRPRAAPILAPEVGERYDLPSGVKVSWEPEDMWAYVNLKFPEIPPVEYDHPYSGKATVYYASDEIWTVCNIPKAEHPPGSDLTGCAIHRGSNVHGTTECTIIIAPETILKRWGLTYRIVLRHEIAHCNGWGKDHVGAR